MQHVYTQIEGSATRRQPVGLRVAGGRCRGSRNASDSQLLHSHEVHTAIERRDLAQEASETRAWILSRYANTSCVCDPHGSRAISYQMEFQEFGSVGQGKSGGGR